MIALLATVLALASPAFLTPDNLLNIAEEEAPLAIVAVAGTLVIISGGFDLSTGSIAAVANVCAAWMAMHSPLGSWGLIAAPAVGLALGFVNGTVITRLRIHSFLGTLAGSLVYSGLALLITNGYLISIHAPHFTDLGQGKLGPVYLSVLLLVGWLILGILLLNKTVLGRHVFAVGGNPVAARLSGVRVDRVKIAAFAFSGLAAGLAGAVLVSRVGSGEPTTGSELTLGSIAAVILGGTSINGGVGAIWRSLAGVFLLALIANGFNLLGTNPFYQSVVTGLVIVAAVALSAAKTAKD
jgi:ribose transport system permease protein